MRLIILLILTTLNIMTACTQVKNDTIMIEKYNFEATYNGTKSVLLIKGEWIIDIWGGASTMCQFEYAPARDFYMIYKEYYKDGIIKSKQEYLANVSIGYTKYYDEQGSLIQEIDEDKKFGKIKPRDVVEILEKIGLFNRKTGGNIIVKETLPIDGNFYKTLVHNMTILFIPSQLDRQGKQTAPPQWIVSYMDRYTEVKYTIDGDNGEYTVKKTEIGIIK